MAAGGMPDMQQIQQQQQKAEQQEQQRKEIIEKIFTLDARERIKRIELVKADKARMIENMGMEMAQKGALKNGPITEEMLKQMLDGMNESSESNKPKIVFKSRGAVDSDDSDIDLDGL